MSACVGGELVVDLAVQHAEILKMHVVARLDRRRRISDHLPVFQNPAALFNRLHGDLVPARNLSSGDDAPTPTRSPAAMVRRATTTLSSALRRMVGETSSTSDMASFRNLKWILSAMIISGCGPKSIRWLLGVELRIETIGSRAAVGAIGLRR